MITQSSEMPSDGRSFNEDDSKITISTEEYLALRAVYRRASALLMYFDKGPQVQSWSDISSQVDLLRDKVTAYNNIK